MKAVWLPTTPLRSFVEDHVHRLGRMYDHGAIKYAIDCHHVSDEFNVDCWSRKIFRVRKETTVVELGDVDVMLLAAGGLVRIDDLYPDFDEAARVGSLFRAPKTCRLGHDMSNAIVEGKKRRCRTCKHDYDLRRAAA